MRSVEEIRQAVHVRAGELRHRQAYIQLLLSGGASGVLSVMLLAVIGTFGDLWHRPLAESYTGASLLGDSAGGYVMVAVAAFMLGVVVTVILLRRRKQEEHKADADEMEIGVTAEASIIGIGGLGGENYGRQSFGTRKTQ